MPDKVPSPLPPCSDCASCRKEGRGTPIAALAFDPEERCGGCGHRFCMNSIPNPLSMNDEWEEGTRLSHQELIKRSKEWLENPIDLDKNRE